MTELLQSKARTDDQVELQNKCQSFLKKQQLFFCQTILMLTDICSPFFFFLTAGAHFETYV